MKRNFSSLENKKLNDLKAITGGLMDSSAINYVPTNNGDCYDKETWVDHKYKSTIEVC
ncbi:putative peptide modification target (TIGR04139 family) [Chryseobacterium sediminis]|uniref:Peptide modification target (TIGR04139 family) n=2 Tax=Chryseobacterium sediminis TaxID=1679494 RepID=A0ABR6Q5W5_9FLAO|nr:putative peptide modification target (TIGR04139 family) [Chryseobacterium sediminis]